MTYGSVLRPGNPFTGGGADSMIASSYDAQDPRSALAVELMNRVFFSLALMNCRNVTLRERGTSKAKRPGPSGDAFHEVVIDGNSRGPAGVRGETAGDGATAPGARPLQDLHRRLPAPGKACRDLLVGLAGAGPGERRLHREVVHAEGRSLTVSTPSLACPHALTCCSAKYDL
jgi:hypothetical protein